MLVELLLLRFLIFLEKVIHHSFGNMNILKQKIKLEAHFLKNSYIVLLYIDYHIIIIYIIDSFSVYIYNILSIYIYKFSTCCFEHSGDISCSLLVNPSHTDESWEGRNTCLYIYVNIYIHILYIYIYILYIYIYIIYIYIIYIYILYIYI